MHLRASAGVEARAVKQLATFDAPMQFSRAEGIIPAPESAHAIRVAIDEAFKCQASGEKKVIALNRSGQGTSTHLHSRAGANGVAYQAYHHGQLEDYEYPVEAVEEAMAHLRQVRTLG